jgi:hypothetical protein
MTPYELAREVLLGAERTRTDLASTLDLSDEVISGLRTLAYERCPHTKISGTDNCGEMTCSNYRARHWDIGKG